MAMFKGSRGMVVRCRRCGKSIPVLNPGEIASDKSVLNGVTLKGDHSGKGSTEPAVSPTKEEYYPPPNVEPVPLVEEQARIPQEDRDKEKFSVLEVELDPPADEQAGMSQEDMEEEEFSFVEAGKKSSPRSVQPYAITGFYPSFPESPPKNRRVHAVISTPIVAFVLMFVLLLGVPVSLVSPSLGKRVFADLGRGIEEVSTIFGT
jgi:hypothetical protein